MADGSTKATGASDKVLPHPTRTISDEFREFQYIVNQFQQQLNSSDGTVGLHPFGPVNVEQGRQAFSQACKRLRDGLINYRDTTLASWNRMVANEGSNRDTNLTVLTNRATAATQELVSMRKITDSLHEDVSKCRTVLLDAAGDAISRALKSSAEGDTSRTTLLVERLKASAKRMGLAHYIDVQKHDGGSEVTTVTLAGGILVIDVDIGSTRDTLKVKVSYVSDIEHDERIDALMLGKLKEGDIHGFEKLVQEIAVLDRLTKERSPANFIHNTFAIIATLAEIQKQELVALENDTSQLLRYGTGIALPHTRHVGPSTLYYIPAVAKAGLTKSDWEALESNSLEDIADVDGCSWLYYSWEPTNSFHCFLSALFQQYCLSPDYTIEDSESHKVVIAHHPTIHGLDMRFLEFVKSKGDGSSDVMQVDRHESSADINEEFWIPYTLVAQLEPPLPACALTVRGIMATTDGNALTATDPASKSLCALQDSPRLLEDAPTLEYLVSASSSKTPGSHAFAAGSNTAHKSTHVIADKPAVLTVEQPQIRAWSIYRVPISHPRKVLSIVPLLRRQATFNELLASCFGEVPIKDDSDEPSAVAISVSVRTHANDPFRIDMLIQSSAGNAASSAKMDVDSNNTDSSDSNSNNGVLQGVVLRVTEPTGDIMAWVHQDLDVTISAKDPLGALGGISSSSLNSASAHKALSKVAKISNSIPVITSWLLPHSN